MQPNEIDYPTNGPRSKRPRSIQLARSPSIDGVGAFFIRTDQTSVYYTFFEIPCFIGGRGFAVHRMGLGKSLSRSSGQRGGL